MKSLVMALFLVVVAGAFGQDFLGKWTIVKVFTTANLDKDRDNRMMLLVGHVAKTDSPVEGVILPRNTTVEFSINPGNKAQHVTLSSDGLLLMSLNWKEREPPVSLAEPQDKTLKVWTGDEWDYDIYTLLYNDAQTLVFSDKYKEGNPFFDIYYLKRTE